MRCADDPARPSESLPVRLADAGVPLFEEASGPPRTLDERDLADLIADLLRSGSERFAVAVPCLLAAQGGTRAARAAEAAAAALSPGDARRLGLLLRIARCLAVSRSPDLEDRMGGTVRIPPASIEPADLPPPEEGHGRAGLAAAREREEEEGLPGLTGGAERAFDTWLSLLAVRSRADGRA